MPGASVGALLAPWVLIRFWGPPAPVDVAIIGLGSGDTAWAAGCRTETRSVTVFELAAPQPVLLSALAAAHELPDLRRFLQDPRLRVRVADGRTALTLGTGRYDVIEADALWPDAAYSGNVYSVEFFERAAGPIPIDRPAWQARLASAEASYLGRRDPQLGALLEQLQPLNVSGLAWRRHEVNRDLFPRDEFMTP